MKCKQAKVVVTALATSIAFGCTVPDPHPTKVLDAYLNPDWATCGSDSPSGYYPEITACSSDSQCGDDPNPFQVCDPPPKGTCGLELVQKGLCYWDENGACPTSTVDHRQLDIRYPPGSTLDDDGGTPLDPTDDTYTYPPTVAGIVLYVHGGAWVGHPGRKSLHKAAEALLTKTPSSWIVASIDYRSADESNGEFLANVRDVKAAVRFLKKRLGLQPIIGMGWSAGGHLVSVAAVSAGEGLDPDTSGSAAWMDQYDSEIDGVINLAGPMDLGIWITETDFANIDNNSLCAGDATLSGQVADLLDCTVPLHPDASLPECCQPVGNTLNCTPNVENASVTTWLDNEDPPFYVTYAANDERVIPRSGCDTAWAHEYAGRRHEFWVDLIEDCATGPAPGCCEEGAFASIFCHTAQELNTEALLAFAGEVCAFGQPPPCTGIGSAPEGSVLTQLRPRPRRKLPNALVRMARDSSNHVA